MKFRGLHFTLRFGYFFICVLTTISCQPLLEIIDHTGEMRRKEFQRRDFEEYLSEKRDHQQVSASPYIYNYNDPYYDEFYSGFDSNWHSPIYIREIPTISNPISLEGLSMDSFNPGLKKNPPFFWIAEKNGKKIYLLGTIHLNINYEDLQCSHTISQYMEESSLGFVETNPEDFESLMSMVNETSQDMMKDSNFKNQNEIEPFFFKTPLDNPPITDFSELSPKAQTFLQSKLSEAIHQQAHNKETTQDLDQEFVKKRLSKINYWGMFKLLQEFCANGSSMPSESATIALGMGAEHPDEKQETSEIILDYQIRGKIHSKGIPLDYLDQLEDKLNVLLITRGFTRNQNTLVTKQHIEDFIADYSILCSREKMQFFEQEKREFITDNLRQMLSAYLSGDKEKLNAAASQGLTVTFEFDKQYGLLNEAMVNDLKDSFAFDMLKFRNEKWLHKLIAAHESHADIFVAAGTLHFIGEFNVLDLLKGKGYTIKRLNSNCRESFEYQAKALE